ncbi:MAG: type III pantothenate kinase [Candidatus Cyclobacteriaceae bacterium M3_2C_046]
MNLAIDLGNSFAKVGVFKGLELVKVEDKLPVSELVDLVNSNLPQHLIIGSVRKNVRDIMNQFDENISIMKLDHLLPVPVKIEYQTPETLGVDRIAGVVGASIKFPGEDILVIDCGTCITYDLITSKKIYLGGAITPGYHMKLKALNTFTANLPLVELDQGDWLIGKSTHECILSGVIHGTIAELDGMIQNYQQLFKNLKIILTGGGANFFESKLKGSIFAVPHLVLYGLNSILIYNVEKNN